MLASFFENGLYLFGRKGLWYVLRSRHGAYSPLVIRGVSLFHELPASGLRPKFSDAPIELELAHPQAV
jgi:hypothetical protein